MDNINYQNVVKSDGSVDNDSYQEMQCQKHEYYAANTAYIRAGTSVEFDNLEISVASKSEK